MRSRFLVAAIVASLGLAACSNGGSAMPGATSPFAGANGQSSLKLAIEGSPLSQCPASKYIGCITVALGHPAKYTICVSSSGNCSSGSFPNEKWTTKFQTLKKQPVTKFKGTFKPNPGNPTTAMVKATVKLKNSFGKVVYVQIDKACPPKGGSCVTGKIGIIPK